ncbi:MAG: TonB dependent receptor [Bacteroidetes bacterium]|nr:TonB dependent receptor [Bacteroidota bacterium]
MKMKMKMKINIGYFLFVMFCLNAVGIKAQEGKDSLINVAFGTVAKNDLLGAVSTVNMTDLMRKAYSTYSLNELPSLVGGYNGNVWGQTALVMVDGIPRDASLIRSSEIESVTVLKGASAVVLYGSRAAKGVILITTKRGKAQPLRIDIRANSGFYVPKRYPKYLNSSDYMTLYNEACTNDGITQKYSQDVINNTAVGTNAYRYPNINLLSSDYLTKAYNKTDATGEVSGGNQNVRYYANFGMSYNNSLLKYGKQRNNNDYKFYIRSNVDMNLSKWLTASTDANVTIFNSYTGRGDFWANTATLRPNSFSPLIPISMLDATNSSLQTIAANSNNVIDGKYLLGGASSYQTNVLADMLVSGYSKNKNRSFMFDVKVGADLGMVLKGLSFKTVFSVDYTDSYAEYWKVGYTTYQPTWSTVNGQDVITALASYGSDTHSTSEIVGTSAFTQTMSFSSQFNYNRTFAQDHNVSAVLVGWGYQTQTSRDPNSSSSIYHRTSNVNLGLQATYNYQHKYYLDLSGAEVHSAKLPSGNRDAFSPSVTLGWRLSNENFFKDNISFVDNLKLTASYANLNQDIDISNYYMYQGYYAYKGGWYQWHDGTAGGWTTTSKQGGNPNLTYIKRKEYRAGLEASLLNKLITLDANYFYQNTNGLLTQGSATIYPSYFSDFLPYMNYNNDRRTGVDFTVNLNKKIGQVDCTLGLSGMFYSSKAVRRDEVYNDAYQNRAGKPLDASWGYICEGFFQDQNDIKNHATQQFGTVKPGDLKYKDVNGDNVVDSKDQVNLGHSASGAAPFTFGINLTLKWKNFTLFAMGTGNTGAVGFKNNSYYWVYGDGKYSNVVWGRWTEATKNTATYPRLTTTSTTNNFMNSTFWRYKTDRFDLSRVQLTYDFPKRLFTNLFVRDMSVYVNGESLLTIAKERKLMETNIGSAPQCRFFNVGLKASF